MKLLSLSLLLCLFAAAVRSAESASASTGSTPENPVTLPTWSVRESRGSWFCLVAGIDDANKMDDSRLWFVRSDEPGSVSNVAVRRPGISPIRLAQEFHSEGLQQGDEVVSIAGKRVSELQLGERLKLLMQSKKPVTLEVRAKDEAKLRKVKVERRQFLPGQEQAKSATGKP